MIGSAGEHICRLPSLSQRNLRSGGNRHRRPHRRQDRHYQPRARLDVQAGNFTSAPWAYNGRIFCLSEEAKTFVFPAIEKFELLAVNQLDEMAQATPAIVGGRLLLRTESRLYSIRAR